MFRNLLTVQVASCDLVHLLVTSFLVVKEGMRKAPTVPYGSVFVDRGREFGSKIMCLCHLAVLSKLMEHMVFLESQRKEQHLLSM
jgi:hypothetical protein